MPATPDLVNDCRSIGRDLRDRGRHATEPANLAPWCAAYRDYPDLVSDLGYNVAIAEIFCGYCERDGELFTTD